ncbi:MAG TPA: leishmanolysin-related zinc metalloendopeptidase [Gemmatimonadaceae bacterium]
MKLRVTLPLLAVVVLGACDRTTAPPKPAAIRIVSGEGETGTAGRTLATPPTFVVVDERGGTLADVGVTITVAAGGGVIANSPTRTLRTATSVGTWTLGQKAGVNRVSVQVSGLPALIISVTGAAGAAAKITALTSLTLGGRVGERIAPAPSAIVSDSFDNAIGGAPVTVSLAGGGSAPANLTADAAGRVDVDGWTLGTIAGRQSLTLTSGAATATFVATAAPGDPTRLVTVSGDRQRALAGSVPLEPMVLRVVDRFGNGIGGLDAALTVTAGGGSTSAPSVRSADDGSITISSWTLGKSAVPQMLRAMVGGFAVDLSATIETNYDIEVRFFGPPMTESQRAVFTNAAARLSAIVVGDVGDVVVSNLNLTSVCGLTGLPLLNETIDDLVIYASVRDIDGPRGILAQAGPCVFRPASAGFLSVAGVMEFDAADIALMAQQGTLQDVITHEMLHVLGIGTLWSARSLVQATGTPNVAYYGLAGTKGCVDAGGTVVCATSVPVENSGGAGTADSHWRETTFRTELMTGFVNTGGMPLSLITVGSLGDIGYLVNPFAADPFNLPGTSASTSITPGEAWERPLIGGVVLDGRGGVQFTRRP